VHQHPDLPSERGHLDPRCPGVTPERKLGQRTRQVSLPVPDREPLGHPLEYGAEGDRWRSAPCGGERSKPLAHALDEARDGAPVRGERSGIAVREIERSHYGGDKDRVHVEPAVHVTFDARGKPRVLQQSPQHTDPRRTATARFADRRRLLWDEYISRRRDDRQDVVDLIAPDGDQGQVDSQRLEPRATREYCDIVSRLVQPRRVQRALDAGAVDEDSDFQSTRLNTSEALMPPKPNELDRTYSTRCSRPTDGM
jgi:hypothetical protein